MRGDLEISEVKLANLLGVGSVETAQPHIVEEVTKAPVGFAGPINLFGVASVPYYFDTSVRGMRNFLCGANQRDVHYINVNAGRDFPAVAEFHDLSKAVTGSVCLNCKKGVFEEKRGIELGHIFQLQQAYSRPMNATFVAADGARIPFWMGCYGIGVSRIVQAAVEQHNDKRGIIWPWTLAPFQVAVIPVIPAKHLTAAEPIYERLCAAGFRVLLDDRDARIGEKLTDMELLGWPIQVLAGRSWESDNLLEVRLRDTRHFDATGFRVMRESLPTAFMSVDQLLAYLANINEVVTTSQSKPT